MLTGDGPSIIINDQQYVPVHFNLTQNFAEKLKARSFACRTHRGRGICTIRIGYAIPR